MHENKKLLKKKKKEDAINKSECPQVPHTVKKRPGPKVDNGEKSRV